MTTAPTVDPPRPQRRPELAPEQQGNGERLLVAVFTGVPFLALFAAIPLAWGSFLGWTDVVLVAVFYVLSAGGITVGYHRYFTHGSFKAKRPLKIFLAVAGSMAMQGPVITWVADHRRHHKHSDKEFDPHSPWRFGNDWKALAKGLVWAHYGWLFDGDQTSKPRFAKDLLNDRDLTRIHRLFPALVGVSFLLPAALGGLITMSWTGFLTALFWAGFVRISLVHHVTWSINSICHTFGKEDFQVRDKSRNVWWLAIPSLGESWHNLHHSDPTCARHGVLKGQIDISARIIQGFEKAGWAYGVRWPDEERLASRRTEQPV
ncbi:acyl-CoA desaturase [Actinomadura algeriensis]|uniref:Stearoyl-CoA desaturase (Delta-9 desaturase) n=1 Tax=Actinomadura algeriensis TaxID=1679523 RepID=A0ABR9JU75_9ACTN|nr:acyl-CoA desaturase [Actinomadura algeriensis]MBE1534058.1 stearoyl-CoA desaturase (delta-9 desaturase) [Actinomadura algeriensis]